ncbi:MAG TPA: DUF1287 domain-containing protein, partial [Bifidobacterium pullorum]|nr:DUF1287 domain-containing protein [Bifidobacterium pullorum]
MHHGSFTPPRRRTGRRIALLVTAIAAAAAIIAGTVGYLASSGVITPPSGTVNAADDSMRKRYPMTPSPVDFDGDGVDDYTDILNGARKDAEAAPIYDDGYYQGGYPPADRGACTDVVWRAFAEAGYDLKAMVD